MAEPPSLIPTTPDRPLVTLAVIAYRQRPFIRAAIEGAFAQTYQPLEIILSDDHSPDGTFAVMQDMAAAYTGPHRIVLRQEPANRGLIGHINAVLAIAQGEYIVPAAGDDISEPNRIARLAEHMATGPRLIHSNYIHIDEEGRPVSASRPTEFLRTGDLALIAQAPALYVGATGCWHRELYTAFGPIEEPAAYEDLVMGYRAALSGKVVYVNEPLVRWRIGSGLTTRLMPRHEKAIRAGRATIASLSQRLADTLRYAPDRTDLIALIERQRRTEIAALTLRTEGSGLRHRLRIAHSTLVFHLRATLARLIRKGR